MKSTFATNVAAAIITNLLLAAVVFIKLSAVPPIAAQQPERNLLVSYSVPSQPQRATIVDSRQPAPALLVTHVSSSPLEEGDRAGSSLVLEASELTGRDYERWLTRRHESTMGARWEKFEAEFGIQQKSPSRFKGMLQSVMYKVDETLFVAQDFANNVDDALDYEYHFAEPKHRSGSFNPRRKSIDSAYLKFNVDFKPTRAAAYVGLKLVVPLGD